MVTLTRKLLVDERELFVFDNLIPRRDQRELAESLTTLPYARCQVDTLETQKIFPDYRYFSVTVDKKGFQKKQLFQAVVPLLAKHFPNERLKLDRAYVNQNVFGDISFVHTDSRRDPDVTAVYFAHERWHIDWGGETMFFDRNDDASFAVSPKPGRLILFRGNIKHKVGVPTRQCMAARFTIAFKFLGQPVSRRAGAAKRKS